MCHSYFSASLLNASDWLTASLCSLSGSLPRCLIWGWRGKDFQWVSRILGSLKKSAGGVCLFLSLLALVCEIRDSVPKEVR